MSRLKIRPEFLIPTKSYADNTPEATPDLLDCSLGVNPYGAPEEAAAAIRAFDLSRLSDYPHSRDAEAAILRLWRGRADLSPENLVLTDGSIAALYLINCLFSAPGARVVGFAPTFTDMAVNCRMLGMDYRGVPMTDDAGADVDRLLSAITPDTAMVYVDNPNNPTGRTLPVEALARIAERAGELGACAVIDEAYGDFIPREESILTRRSQYDNLIVVRTFSKGFGLAGLRAGYIAASPEVTGCIAKISNPYMMSALSRAAVAALSGAADYPISHSGELAAVKEALASAVGTRLRLLPTDPRVPICTLRHSKPGTDLQRLLCGAGILTVSGAEFDGLDAAAVRLRVPRSGPQAGRLIQAVRAVERG